MMEVLFDRPGENPDRIELESVPRENENVVLGDGVYNVAVVTWYPTQEQAVIELEAVD